MSETFQQVAERLTNIRAELDGAIAILTMNRPKALNALNDQTLEELDRIFTCLEREESILGVIITGEGKGFVAGADISQMQSYKSEEGRNYANRAQALFNKIEALEKPVIAAVNGYALGGGCELSMSCDIRIASEKAVFGQPEANLGGDPLFWRYTASAPAGGDGYRQRTHLYRPSGKSRGGQEHWPGQQSRPGRVSSGRGQGYAAHHSRKGPHGHSLLQGRH